MWRRLVPAKRKSSSSSAAAEAGASSKSGGSAHKAFLQSVQMHASRAVEHHLTQHALTTGVALVSAAVGTSVNSAHHGKSTKTGRLGKLSNRQRAELARMSAKEQRKYEGERAAVRKFQNVKVAAKSAEAAAAAEKQEQRRAHTL